MQYYRVTRPTDGESDLTESGVGQYGPPKSTNLITQQYRPACYPYGSSGFSLESSTSSNIFLAQFEYGDGIASGSTCWPAAACSCALLRLLF